MNEIRIEYSLGPYEKDQEIVGSYYLNSTNNDEKFIISAIKKSIAKLQLEKEKFIVGVFDVFINDIKSYEIALMSISTIHKIDIKKM